MYEVGATDEPLVVELRPSGFNGALELSRLGSSVAPQVQGTVRLGRTQLAMIGAGETKHRIEVSGLGAGEFELMVRPANSSRLWIPARDRTVPIQSTGQPTVLAVDGSAGEAFVVTVEVTRNGETEEIPDAARLEIVDPDGVTTAALHDQPTSLRRSVEAKQGPTWSASRTLPVRPSGNTACPSARSAITSASLGAPTAVLLSERAPYAAVQFESPDDSDLLVELRDDNLAAHAQIQSPDGTVLASLDPGGISMLTGGAGRYMVFITTELDSVVTLNIDVAEGADLAPGTSVRGPLDADHGAALYRVEATGEDPLLAEVTAAATLDVVLSLVGVDGPAVEPADLDIEGGTERPTPSVWTRGPLLFEDYALRGHFGRFPISRCVRLKSLRSRPARRSSGHLEPGQIELYSLTATDSPFAVAVTSVDLGAELGVDGPQGEEFPQIDNVFLSSGVAGEYMLTVRRPSSPVDFQISADELPRLDSGDIAPGAASISGPGDIDVLGVELPDDPIESVTITADPGLEVDAMVTDSFGNEVGRTSGPVAGSALVTLLDASGPHFVIVTGVSGTGAVKVAVKAIEEEPLTPGTPVTFVAVAGQVALFTLEQGDGLFAIEIRPNQGVTTSLAVIDTIGNLFGGEESLDSPHLLVVDARYGPLRVFVGPTEGSGEIALLARPIATLPLELGETLKGAIRAPGDVIAYDVTVGDLELLASVLPSADLDVQVTVIDSIAFLETTDVLPAGDGEDALLVGEPGLFRVIVSGVGGSSGDFEVALEEATPDSGI